MSLVGGGSSSQAQVQRVIGTEFCKDVKGTYVDAH